MPIEISSRCDFATAQKVCRDPNLVSDGHQKRLSAVAVSCNENRQRTVIYRFANRHQLLSKIS
jgi:hypothetical protein